MIQRHSVLKAAVYGFPSSALKFDGCPINPSLSPGGCFGIDCTVESNSFFNIVTVLIERSRKTRGIE